jgi:hypothetical protein
LFNTFNPVLGCLLQSLDLVLIRGEGHHVAGNISAKVLARLLRDSRCIGGVIMSLL